MANASKIVMAILFVLGGVLLFLSSSETSFGQPFAPGCCITNGNQCSPSCGPEGSSCQNEGGDSLQDIAQCNNTINPPITDCGTSIVNCYVEGAVCFQVASNKGECRAAAPPEQTGCCGNIQNPSDSLMCQEGVTFSVCEEMQGTFSSSGSCQPDNSCFVTTGQVIVPTLSQWGMIIMAGFLGLIGIFFATRRFASRGSS
jgi:hypothetical protein